MASCITIPMWSRPRQIDRAGFDPVHGVPQAAPRVGVQLMDAVGHLLLDLADLLAQPFYGGLDLAEPFGKHRSARNSWPRRFTEPVVKEMPDLARYPKQCAKRAPPSHHRGCYRASAHDALSEIRGVRGMHRPLQYPFRRFPPMRHVPFVQSVCQPCVALACA